MKGRRPKPVESHILGGTFRADRHGTAQPTAMPTMPTMPEHLDSLAKAEWARVTAEMFALGTLAKADAATIGGYCTTVSRWAQAEQELQKTGLVIRTQAGDVKANPYVKIAQDSLAMLRQYAIELGLSPSSRTRIKTGPQQGLPDEFELAMHQIERSKKTGKYHECGHPDQVLTLAEVQQRIGDKSRFFAGHILKRIRA